MYTFTLLVKDPQFDLERRHKSFWGCVCGSIDSYPVWQLLWIRESLKVAFMKHIVQKSKQDKLLYTLSSICSLKSRRCQLILCRWFYAHYKEKISCRGFKHVAHEFILACCMTNVKTVLKSLIIQLFLFNKPKYRSRHLSKVKCISASQQVVWI